MTPEEQAKKAEEDYRLQARALFDLNGDRLRFTSQIQADHGKWLLLTVTSTNLAALYLISRPEVPDAIRQDMWCYWPFVIGICLILLAGMATWANWTLGIKLYDKWSDVRSLTNRDYGPKDADGYLAKGIKITFYLPWLLGAPAALCIPWGAYNILHHL